MDHDDREMDPRLEADAEAIDDELRLRPGSLDEYVGQEQLLATLRVFIAAARQRDEALTLCTSGIRPQGEAL